jgi:transcriptional regulator with XRE-family HTH domain
MDDQIDLHIGRRLRNRRKLLGLTQEQLAAACDVRFQQIQKYECGANRMSAARLWRLAQFLDVPVSYFYDGLPTELRPLLERSRARAEAAADPTSSPGPTHKARRAGGARRGD